MAVRLCPIWNGAQFFTNTGVVLAGGKINQYLAGTTTTAATYTDSTGAVQNGQPIVLDSTGRYASQIWFTAGASYKLILTDSANNIIATEDSLVGINDVSTASLIASEWVVSGWVPVYVSTTSFTVAGNQTAILVAGRRLQITVNAGTVYATVVSSVFSSVTTVVVTLDSGALDVGISVVNYGLLGEVNPSVPSILTYGLTATSLASTNWSIDKTSGLLRNTGNTQPQFYAYVNTNNTTLAANTAIPFQVIQQQGGTNLAGTGIFTAPVTGVYLFMSTLWLSNVNAGSLNITCSLYVNGQPLSNCFGTGNSTTQVATQSMFVVSPMTAGQTAYVATSATFSAGAWNLLGNASTQKYYSNFQGVLLF